MGKKYIAGDPHDISPNGIILATIVERQQIVVGNGTSICQGTITRTRATRDRTEKSAIDLVMFSSDLKNNLVSLKIDEKREHVLSKVIKTKKGPKFQESDHNPIITEFDLALKDIEKEKRKEIYNFKNKEGLAKFRALTSNTKMLSSVFDSNDNIDIQTDRFLKKLNGCISMSFKKIRINQNKAATKSERLHEKMTTLKAKTDQKSKEELEAVVKDLAIEAEENFNKVKEELEKVKTNKGGMNSKQIWSLKKKLCPKSKDPPTAILDSKGNLLTAENAIQNRAKEVFIERLQSNKIEEHLEDLEEETSKLCQLRLKLSKLNKTQPWDIEDLKNVLRKLPPNKSRDADGYSNELFALGGDDLQEALLKLLNQIKDRQEYPKALRNCNITTLYKKKSRNDFKKYRGIFRISVIRSILDRLIYEDSFEVIDSNLTDGNVGCRKNRSPQDNIYVIGAITNSVINGDSRPNQSINRFLFLL